MRKTAVIIVASIVALQFIFGLTNSQTATAVLDPGSGSSPKASTPMPGVDRNTLSAKVLYYTIERCFAKREEISNEHVIKGAIDNDEKINVGHFMSPDGGEATCEEIASEIKKRWYGDSMEAMISDFGYELDTDKNQWTMDKKKGGEVVPRILRRLESKMFGGGKPPALTDAEKYILYNQALVHGCKLSNRSEPISDMKKSKATNYESDPYKYLKVAVILERGVSYVFYEYDGYGGNIATPGVPGIKPYDTCSDLANSVNSTIYAYNRTLTSKDRSDTEAASEAAKNNNSDNDSDSTTCDIDGVGWIICPAMNFLAELNDAAFGFIAGNFLEVNSAGLRDDKTLREAWGTFRTLANAAFVVAFLIIVYSQMVGRN